MSPDGEALRLSLALTEDAVGAVTRDGRWHAGSLRDRLAGTLEAERDRWFLWAPVMMGAGIGLYFALPAEPRLALALAPFLVALILYGVVRQGVIASVLLGALMTAAAGFAIIKVRTGLVAAPVLERPMRAAPVTGWVELVEPRPSRGQRLTILVHELGSLAPEARPWRVRVRTLKTVADLRPGDAIRLKATLSPPSGPPIPGGYDFGRSAYFQAIGAVGYSMSTPEPAHQIGAPPWRLRAAAAVQRLRQAIGARVTATLPGETGAIATALLTGERGAITDATNEAYRDSGLLHVLSISGLHMAVMAGAVFVTLRFLLALWPAVALRYSIKKWAAAGAALAALGYLMISGSSSATVRSYLMISVMFLAILLDRPGIALRNVAIAALMILLVAPETLHDVGFQMSFAAVVALVAGFEALRDRRRLNPREGRMGPVPMGLMFLGGIVLTTLIASFAVAPFAAYHFHKSQQYAILANLIAIPICNVVVMPAALATLVAMPFGLEALPVKAMGLGIEAMSWCARTVAALPGAVGRIPAIPSHAFAAMVIGGLWLALWRTRWRLLGLAAVVVGLALAPGGTRPDLLVGRDGALVAARLDGRQLTSLKGRGSEFELARWLEHDGDIRTGKAVASGEGFRCDRIGCTTRIKGRLVAMPSHPAALPDDCSKADILLLRWPRPSACPATKATVIDYWALRDDGVHWLTIQDERVEVRSVGGERGARPWTGREGAKMRTRRPPSGEVDRLAAFAAPRDLLDPEDARPDLAAEAAGGE